MTKVRVYEVAKQLNVDKKVLVTQLQAMGLADVKNHMSSVTLDDVERVKRALDRQRAPAVEEKVKPGVVRRRAPVAPEAPPSGKVDVPPPPPSGPVPPIRRPSKVVAEPAPEPAIVEPPPPPPASARVEPPPAAVVMEPPKVEAPVQIEPPAPEPPPPPPVVRAPEPPPPPPVVEVPPPSPPAPPPAPPPSQPPASEPPRPAARPSTAPKTGIETWAGRPGVPMPPPQAPRSQAPAPRRQEFNIRPTGGQPLRPGQQPQRPMSGGLRGGPHSRRFGPPQPKRPVTVSTKEMGADKKVIKIEERVNLQVLAGRMSLKATEVLMKLLSLGMAGAHINSSLDADTAKLIAGEFGWEVEDVAVSEETQLSIARGEADAAEEGGELRPAIVTVMGHVDHGKTSLLDQIRKTSVANGEAGGITQHIGAYRVQTARGPICFLDTPGHEAFTAMRARGASVTDIVVLVVAADDGVMPQTREAIAHARAAKVPIVVAVNKIDKPDANPERVKRQLMEVGLVPDDLGGDTLFVPVSAKTREGVDDLLENLALQSEIMDLRAKAERPAHGIVIEALLDRGKGPVARVIVTDGTLHVGDFVLSGPAVGKVRAMTDDRGRPVSAAGPATPVEVLGLSDVPNAGDLIDAVRDTKKAQEIAEGRRVKARNSMAGAQRISMEDFAARAALAEQAELRVIVKGDVQGSVEALTDALSRLSGPKVRLSVINGSVGAITEGDINLAIASKAIIIGFNTRPAGKAGQLAEAEGVQIKQYNIIYNVIDEVRSAMEGLLPPTLVEKPLGKAEVRLVLKLSKAGTIAGSMVTEGVVKRNAKVRVRREAELLHDGKVVSLKRFKEDVKEVAEGFECGIGIDDFDALKEGDVLEVYEVEEVRQKLSLVSVLSARRVSR
ncbi:MAG: translation initiation factor IF-2 [Polyangiaceae bacterium]|nr:translation initiation factor IF-2 [Polyangiaceae bacterium]